MSVVVSTVMNLTVLETVNLDPQSSGSPKTTTLQHDGMNTTVNGLSATTTPAVSKVATFTATLTSGAVTIDLTNITTTANQTVSGNGLRVQSIKIQAPTTNANVISVTPGASNGYANSGGFIFTASDKIHLNAGDEIMWTNTTGTSAPAIDSSHKTLDLAGTGSQVLNLEIVFG